MPKETKMCVGKESFDRMNYLYQASKLLIEQSTNNNNGNVKKCTGFLSNYYSNLLINVAKKTVLRIDTDIKRKICKGCRSLLILGETARVRIRKKPIQHVRWTCLKCRTTRVYNTSKDYSLWTENAEAVVEVLEYNDDIM